MSSQEEIEKATEIEWIRQLRKKYRQAVVKERTHAFAEAFALMDYQGMGGEQTHRIWNSRNGVTPSIAVWQGAEFQHMNWGRDCCAPRHVPRVGSLIFTDCVPEDIVEITKARVERDWNGPGGNWQGIEYAMRSRWTTKWEAVLDLTKDTYESGVPPHLVEVTEELSRDRGWTEQQAKQEEHRRHEHPLAGTRFA